MINRQKTKTLHEFPLPFYFHKSFHGPLQNWVQFIQCIFVLSQTSQTQFYLMVTQLQKISTQGHDIVLKKQFTNTNYLLKHFIANNQIRIHFKSIYPDNRFFNLFRKSTFNLMQYSMKWRGHFWIKECLFVMMGRWYHQTDTKETINVHA